MSDQYKDRKGGRKYQNDEDQVSRTPTARRTEFAKGLKVATSYDEKGQALGWEPASGPKDTEGLSMADINASMKKKKK